MPSLPRSPGETDGSRPLRVEVCFGRKASAKAGDQVSFMVGTSEKGTIATDVKVLVPAEEADNWCKTFGQLQREREREREGFWQQFFPFPFWVVAT